MTKIELGKNISYDPDEKGYIMFDVTSYVPPQQSQIVDGVKLFPKNEYHSSLVALERYVNDKDQALQIALSIQEYLKTHEIKFVGIDSERYICRKDERMTLVAPVVVDGIDEFRLYVTTLIPSYDPPFSHITLLKSADTEFGIGINSMSELAEYCTILN